MMGQDPEARSGPRRITPWDSWNQALEVAVDACQGAQGVQNQGYP